MSRARTVTRSIRSVHVIDGSSEYKIATVQYLKYIVSQHKQNITIEYAKYTWKVTLKSVRIQVSIEFEIT